MGILKKLFGKKNKENTEEVKQSRQATVETKDVSLEEVNNELKDLDSVQKEKDLNTNPVPTKSEDVMVKKTDRPEVTTSKDAEPEKEETSIPKQTPKTASKPKQASKPKEASKPKQPAKKTVYHVKKHDEGWQVIKENADKAYRVFKYQKEAIDFAKAEDLEYVVFKADGTPRDA